MRTLSTLLLAFLFASCTSISGQYIDRNPGMTAKEQQAVKQGFVYPGMPAQHALAALGMPQDVNKTQTEYGTREQWVYRAPYTSDVGYVYVERDTVRTVQDHGYDITH